MSYTATVLKVMIASPSDVEEERKIIRESIYEWNAINSESRGLILMPVSWETHASPRFDRPQQVINQQVLEGADLLVAVFWTRIGSSTGKAISGTIEELNQHIVAGKPAMLYFSTVPVSPENLDQKQYNALNKFKKEHQRKALFETFESPNAFREKFNRQLSQTILRDFAGLFNAPLIREKSQISDLSDDAKQLLVEASKDNSGEINRLFLYGGVLIQTSNKVFVDGDDPVEEARWEAAIDELTTANLIKPTDLHRNLFKVTKSGYEKAKLHSLA